MAGVSVAIAPPPAWAQSVDANRLYSLSWVRGAGAEDCPPASELRREIERRIGRPLFDGSAPQSIEVLVWRDVAVTPPTRRTDIHVRNATGATMGERTLTSSETDCRSLFSSTALAIALLVDPDATALHDSTTAPRNGSVAQHDRTIAPANEHAIARDGAAARPAPPPQTQPEAPLTQVAAIAARSPSRTATASRVEVAPNQPHNSTRTHAELPAPVVPSDAPKPNRVVQFSLGPLVAIGLIPDTQLGVYVGVRAWELPHLGWSLSATYLPHAQSDARGAASISLGMTMLEPAFMFELLANEHVRLFVDLGGALGSMPIAMRGARAAGPKESVFVAARAELGAQLKLSQIAQLELAWTGFVPLVRHQFVDSSQSVSLFVQPPVGAIGRIGVGIQFP